MDMTETYATAAIMINEARDEARAENGSATHELENLWIAGSIIEKLKTAAVDAARKDGATWAEIGAALEITKQAAQQRYGR